MEVYKIKGGKRLKGTIKVSGAKNSAVAFNSCINIGKFSCNN